MAKDESERETPVNPCKLIVSLGAAVLLAVGLAAPVVSSESPPSEPVAAPVPHPGSWLRWGGPNGDFKVGATDLATSWSEEGPPRIWSRKLGSGYSAIAVDGTTLYAMHRDGGDDVVVALAAGDGSTLWEHRYPAPTREGNMTQFGEGPNATPLVLGDRIVTLGYTGKLHCLDKETGKVLWSHDLMGDFGGEVLPFGYSASPIEHEGAVIVLVGGKKQGVVALSPKDGSTLWSGRPGSVSYATPIVIDVDGQEQLVYFSADEIIGLDPNGGGFLWSFPVVNQYKNNCTPPQWGADGLLWVATQLDGGTRALRLTRDGEKTTVEEIWKTNKMSIHFWNTMLLDGHVYASIGSNASVLAGIELETGEIKWRERGFTQVNFVQAGDTTIMLDADGKLVLARLSPEGVEVLSQAQILDGPTWTAPTLVGTRLYVRDKESIVALDLGETGTP
jgi:outer membrane protein assembly factor BamB